MQSLRTLFVFQLLIAAVVRINCGHVPGSTEVTFKEKYFDQLIDHFNFNSFVGSKTYRERYLISEQFWTPGVGPIYFYAGNEGDIYGFQKASGFLTDLAPTTKALVVFAEHRYYGVSLPFGNMSFTGNNIGFLTIEQALADYAYLIKYLKAQYCNDCPVFAFGGSYGGMLAAYLRFKYPNVVDGSLAASAPIYWISGYEDRHGFFKSVTEQFMKSSKDCVDRVRQGFADTASLAEQGKYSQIKENFRTCQDINADNLNHLYGWVRNSYTILAMMNYPYPANLLGPLPAYPVNVACKKILSAPSAMVGLSMASGVLYNGTSTVVCFDIEKEFIECADPTGCGVGNDAAAWDYQACTEMILPGGSNNITDMFPSLPFTLKMRDEYCIKKYGIKPRNEWPATEFWGMNISSATNIIFSNGDLDPWSPGGVHKNLTSSLIALEVKDGAHHLDLRGSNPNDPQSVKEVRKTEAEILQSWTKSHYEKKSLLREKEKENNPIISI